MTSSTIHGPGQYLWETDEGKRFVEEVLKQRYPKAISQEELNKAWGVFEAMVMDHTMIEMWRTGALVFGWDEEAQDVVLDLANNLHKT
ncbi:hypothetical protein [Mycobacterium avium]|uniref:hypothetical protein n=1 Tax=Mycobacterium avium TaxID=1764 RepID=UPI0009FEEBB4|nr:hypothetical protein [Mycobacterium avium]